MTLRNLDAVFAPRAVAVAGGGARENSVGRAVLRNLRAAGFPGPVLLVNPLIEALDGIRAARSFADLPEAPDLVVVTAPPKAVPEIVAAAGAAGARAAVVVTRGLGAGPGSLRQETEREAQAAGVRLLGPGCLGVQSPHARLNASIVPAAREGDLALLSQSGGVLAATVAWASGRGVGFSGLVSFGEMVDVDLAQLIDHFATDRRTRAILLYIDAVTDAAGFLSAARAAARIKPVVAVKGGRRAAATAGGHIRALVTPDAVYEAAFRRAGLLQVADLGELFAAAETLAHVAPLPGRRIAIVSNGAGLGALAADRLVELGGTPAELSDESCATIRAALGEDAAVANPIDLQGDAPPALYEAALDAALADEGVDAALAIHAPTELSGSAACAEAVVAAARRARARRYPPKPVFAAFMGSDAAPRVALEAAHVPFFRTPEAAVAGLMHLVAHVDAQASLMATPQSALEDFTPDVPRARAAVEAALSAGRERLGPVDVAETLAAYGVPQLPQTLVATPAEAGEAARGVAGGGGVALKIVSADIAHKAAVGGVRLGLESPRAVEEAAIAMLDRVRERAPDARVEGFLLQPNVRGDDARELFAGFVDDPVFGPVIAFGAGGGAIGLLRDVALGLPPLHMGLAREMIDRTRVGALLGAYADRPAADRDALALILVKLAQIAVDMPEILELEVNPLLAGPRGAVALDARIRVAPAERARRRGPANPRLAIRPYPKELESHIALRDGTDVFVRPVRPEDEPAVAEFFRRVSAEDLRQRFFTPVKQAPRALIARLTQIDYARTLALLALTPGGEVLGIVQLHNDADDVTGEYAILLRSDLKGRGLGWRLMSTLIETARDLGLSTVTGQVLAENVTMLAMCRALGFEVAADPDDPGVRIVTLSLRAALRTP